MPLRERSKRLVVQLQQEARILRLNAPSPFVSGPRSRSSTPSSPSGALDDFAITPRRRSGQDRRAPVVLTRELIESYFSMPLSAASKDLGLCATAIKKVCRKMGIAKWPFRDRLLAQKHEEEEAEEAARINGSHLDDMFADDEMDDTAQEQAVSDMLAVRDPTAGDAAAPSADSGKSTQDLPPGPMSEVSDDSVADSTSCEHSVCDGSSPEDDIEGLCVTVPMPVHDKSSTFARPPQVAHHVQTMHQSQVPHYPVKPVAPAPARFVFPGGDCGSVQGSVGFGLGDESCAYPQDSLLDFPVGADNSAGVFDHVVDMEGVLCLD